MPDSMLKHCGLSEYYVHYGWCLGFLVSKSHCFPFKYVCGVAWGRGNLCNNFEDRACCRLFLVRGGRLFPNVCVRDKRDINQRMTKAELKRMEISWYVHLIVQPF